ncbi:MAG: hypothetical protein QM740_19860 [Acidovorax sp.]
MSMRLRLVLLALVLLLLVLATYGWLLARTQRSERVAQQRSARLTTQVLVQLIDHELSALMAGDASSQQPTDRSLAVQASVETAARKALTDLAIFSPQDGAGVLMDEAGNVVLTHPPDLRDALSPERIAKLQAAVGGSSSGWFTLPDAQGAVHHAYFEKSRQNWTWITWMPCSALDLACSRDLPWVIGAATILFLSAGWLMVRAASSSGGAEGLASWESVKEPPLSSRQKTPGGGREHMMDISWLIGRFTHEFNNRLGVISNSACLIERRAQDPGLQLPIKAMLRAVDAASFISQRLQRLGTRQPSRPQPIELQCWLPELRTALGLVLGKGMALDIMVAQEALWVHADPRELELALLCVLSSIRAALPGEGRVIVAPRPWEAGDGPPLPPQPERLIEIRLKARARSSDEAVIGPYAAMAAWIPVESCPALDLGLVHSLCQSAGGSAWVNLEAGHCIVVSMLLPEARQNIQAHS